MLRGFSGAEKLSYSEDVRECVRDHGSLSLHTLVGCPPVIFFKIGQVLEGGKLYLADDLTLQQFQKLLDSTETFLRGWDPGQAVYPTAHREWRQLAEAYRHACLLRIMRFPDTFAVPCDDPRIKASVTTILDICAAMPSDSVFYKRLLFPLFLAGADTCSPHQMHYASLCIDNIKRSTGFQHPAMTEVLTKVWEERRTNPHGWSNVPWMEYVSPITFFRGESILNPIAHRLVLSFCSHSMLTCFSDEPTSHIIGVGVGDADLKNYLITPFGWSRTQQ
jgi:hypothetical protein